MWLTKVPGLPVVDTHVARQAGVVSDVLLDLQAGRVAVLNIAHADGWLVQRIPYHLIHRLGPRTVLVSETVAVDLGPPAVGQPWLPIEAFVGLEVVTDRGEHIGRLTDADLDDESLAVKTYLMRKTGGILRRRRRIRPDEVVMCSQELMLIRARTK